MGASANVVDDGKASVQPDLPAWLMISSGKRIGVLVTEISRRGVRLRVPEPLPVGEAVELELGQAGYAIISIGWNRGSEAGGTFIAMG